MYNQLNDFNNILKGTISQVNCTIIIQIANRKMRENTDELYFRWLTNGKLVLCGRLFENAALISYNLE